MDQTNWDDFAPVEQDNGRSGPLLKESDLRAVVAKSPQDEADNARTEALPGWDAELDRAIAGERDPELRAALEGERASRQGQGGAVDWDQFTPADQAAPEAVYDPMAALNAPVVHEEGMTGAFTRNLKKTLPQTKQLLSGAGALVADTLGADSARDYLMESYAAGEKATAKQTKPTDSWSEGGRDNLGKFIAGSAGYFTGQILESMAVALAAGAAGSAAGGVGAVPAALGGILLKTEAKAAIKTAAEALIEAQIKKSMASGLTKEAAEKAAQKIGAEFARTLTAKAAGKTLGIGGAMIGQGVGMETGEIYGHLYDEAKKEGLEVTDEERGNAWFYGSLAGAVEGLVDKYNLDAVMGGGAKGAGIRQRLMGVLRGAGKAEAREVPTEIAQTGLERAGKNQDWNPSNPEAQKEYIDTAAMTAAGAWIPGVGGARVDATPAQPAPVPKKPNSPLTNAANAAAPAPAVAPATPAVGAGLGMTPSFGSPELNTKHAELAAFLSDGARVDELRAVYPNLPASDEIAHVWENVINNPDVELQTRIDALNQGYALLMDTPNFTQGGTVRPKAAPRLGVDHSIEGEFQPAYDDQLPGRNADGTPWYESNAEARGMAQGVTDGALTAGGDGPIPAATPQATAPVRPAAPAPQAATLPDLKAVDQAFAAGATLVGAKQMLSADGQRITLSNAQNARWLKLLADQKKAAPAAKAETLPQAAPAAVAAIERAEPVLAAPSEAQPVAPAPRSYPKEAATKMATRLTLQGLPSEAYEVADGRFAIRSVAEGQAAPVAAPAPKPAAPAPVATKAKATSPSMQRDDIVGAILRATGGNGIASDMALDLTGDTANKASKLRGLFTNAGQQDMDDLAMLLRENEGYDVADGNRLAELIREAATGNYAKSMARTAQDKADAQEKQHRDLIRQQAKKLGIKAAFIPFGELESKVLAMTVERHAKALGLLDARSEARFHDALAEADRLVPEPLVEAVMLEVHGRGLSGRDFWNESHQLIKGMIYDAQQENINDRTEGAAPEWIEEVSDGRRDQESGRGSPADQGHDAQPSEGEGQTDAVAPRLELAGQTPAEVRAQEAQRQKDEAAKDKAAPFPNVKADQVDLFNTQDALFSSNRDTAPATAPQKSALDQAADSIDAQIDDVAARLAEKLKAKRGTLNSGVDPELLMLGAELGALYIGKGFVKFAQYSRAIINKLKSLGVESDEIKPLLKEFYLASQARVDDATFDQMDDARAVRKFDLESLTSIHEEIAAAEKTTDSNPSGKQKDAENYRKGKFDWNGLTVSIETAKGVERTDKETHGEKWRVTMPATYGYFLGTVGADKDHVDVFVGDSPESHKVFIIDQNQVDSKAFDEHKVMIGFNTAEAAKAAYLGSFSDGFGRKVFGQMSGALTADELKAILPSLKQKKPVTEPVVQEFNVVEGPEQAAPTRPALAKVIDNTESTATPTTAKPAVPEPAGWRKNWGTASKYAEALGLPVRDDRNKFKKFGPLVADIEAHLAEKPIEQPSANDAKPATPSVTTPEGYARVIGNRALQEAHQDVLDSFFQERLIAVRNALRALGYDGVNSGSLSKDGQAISFQFTHVGAGRNVVGMTVQGVVDDLTKTPEALAKAVATDSKAAPQLVENTDTDRANATRLDQLASALKDNKTPQVIRAVEELWKAADELRKPKRLDVMADWLEETGQRLYTSGFAMQSEVVDEIADQLRNPTPPKASRLPAGWTEATPGGMATSTDPVTGGIVDKVMLSDEWFVVPKNKAIENIDGLGSRDEAFGALHLAVEKLKSAKPSENDFVTAPDGTVDFGEITSEMAQSMHRQSGKIRLEKGDETYGEKHIEVRHGNDIRGVGFKSVAEFVADSLQNISSIWKPSKTSQLVVVEATEHGKVVFVELKPSESGDFYTVNSAFPTPANYAAKKEAKDGWVKLWDSMALQSPAPAVPDSSAGQLPVDAGGSATTPSSHSLDQSISSSESEGKTDGAIEDPKARYAVAVQVGAHLFSGKGFDTIIQGRAFVADKLGIGRIEAGTQNAKHADEIIEAGIVDAARNIVMTGRLDDKTPEQIFTLLTNLYERQPRLGVRTSTSMREQAYSTPAPLAYLASELAGIDAQTHVYEPTAGNGMLMIGAKPINVLANELNKDRYDSLTQMFPTAKVLHGDALRHVVQKGAVDAVIANPPFGIVKDANGETVIFETAVGYPSREIDHAIVFKALEAMPDHGRAALIVGGIRANSDEERRDGYRAKSKREFYFNLYNHYKVVNHFTVNGDLYEKQGAGYPVDVIIISGRGESERILPAANLPTVYNSWGELKEVLNENRDLGARGGQRDVTNGRADSAGQGDGSAVVGGAGGSRAGDGAGSGRPTGRAPSGGAGTQPSGGGVAAGGATQVRGANAGDAQSGPSGRSDPAESHVSADRQEQRERTGTDGRSGELGGTGSDGAAPVSNTAPDRRGQETETDKQVTYDARSKSAAVGTLVPVNMRDAVQDSLDRLEQQVGDLDAYVASRLNIDVPNLYASFSAEQVDALAMAINNAENGGGFIIGDQTGIGKGRIVAGMIKYATLRGLTPIFVTEKPNLYADMLRDLADIGMSGDLGYGTSGLRVLMTNDEKVPYGNDGEFEIPRLKGKAKTLFRQMANDATLPSEYKAIFTTYNQLQTVKGEVTDRMSAISALAPNAYLILDESHNAGGTGTEERLTAKQKTAAAKNGFSGGRSGFMRLLVGKSRASFFSSATYAKRPNVMDLYSSTNMILAVDKPTQLGDAIARGGVPLQQIVASMLAQDGQYMRRERSFAGVEYNTGTVTVDKQVAENMASAMSQVLNLSRMKDGAIAMLQAEYDAAGAMMTSMGNDAQTSVTGANFGSIMHNLIDQMLLSLKTKGAAEAAIAALERGEKVVLTVANTMGSFIKEYADDMGLNIGDPVDLSFNDLYRKYLEKQRWVSIKDGNGVKTKYRLTDKDLGPLLARLFQSTDEWMAKADFGGSPISPIDYLHAELRKHKINGRAVTTDEITGRSAAISYTGAVPQLATRNPSIKSRLNAINGFNGGKVDVLVLNQSGSTGLSLHASIKFKDQRKRHMILVQAEKNIDTHMQILGRVHRTGQVVTPGYTQLMADIPAEMRPAAVLLGKMAKLSANTTASKDSDFSAEGVTDFINDYGGQVAVEFLLDNPEIYRALGGSDMMTLNQDEAGEHEIRKLSGYIPLLPIAQQEKIYGELIGRYKELVQRETELGTNKLEAKALDLDAETLSSDVADEGRKGSSSLFAAPVSIERVSVKRTSKPFTQEQVRTLVSERKAGDTGRTIARTMAAQVQADTRAFMADYQKKHTLAGEDLARIDANVDVIRGQLALVTQKLYDYEIGSSHSFDLDGQIFYGIVTDVKHHNRSSNPAAPSTWTVQFALAMADANSVSLPFSQLGTKFKTEAMSVTTWGDLANGGNRSVSLYELFDLAQTSAREKRWMVTGNLLAGYAKFPGQLVHYTKQDGSTSQGILMGRSYDYAKHKELMGARLKNAAKVMAFFDKAHYKAVVTDANQILRIEQTQPGDFILTVPSSKRQGGLYSLDSDLTRILGSDFVSSGGGRMKLTSYSARDVAAAITHVLGDQTDYFTAVTHKDVATQLNDATPSVLRSVPRTPDVAEFTGGIKAPAADALVARLIESLGASTRHYTVPSFFDLPQDVQQDARAQGSDEKTTKGVFHKGTLYVVANNAKSNKDIEETVFHELVGHFGLRKLLGADFVQKTNALFAQLGGLQGLSKIAADNDFGPVYAEYVRGVAAARGKDSARFTDAVSKLILTEEVFAHIAEKRPTLMQKIKALIGQIRDYLRTNGYATLASYGETDILHLLNQARNGLKGPDGGGPRGGVTPGVISRKSAELVGAEYDEGLDFANDFVTELSYEDAAFRYAISKSPTLEGNMSDALPGVEYLGEDTRPDERQESKADHRHVFALPNEKLFYVYTRGNEVWIDVSRLQPGDRGGAIYHGVANYAYNTGKVFVGDPQGLSEDAIVRRTSAMLSSALRFGTTAHIEAAREQINGVPEKGIEPLDWQGNDVAKTKALIHTFVTTLQNQNPDIKNYRYDFRNNQFVRESSDVRGLSGLGGGDERGQAVVGVDGSREGRMQGATRVGEASMRRGILLQSLISSEGGEKPGLLENVLSRSVQLVSSKEGLAAVFRRSPAEFASDALGLKAKTTIADDSGRAYTAEQRALFANVGRETTKDSLPDRVKALWQDAGKKLAQGLVDQFAPIKAISENAYTLLRLSKGAAGAFEAFLQHGKLRVDDDGVYDADQTGGVIEQVFQPIGAESGDFMWWVAANRAEKLSDEDRENLFTPEDIDAGKSLADGEVGFDYTLKNGPKAGTTTRSRNEVYADTLISFNAFHKNAMDVAEASGLIDGEARQYWENEFYIPFYRATDDDGGFKGASIKNGSVRQTAFKRLKGGSDKLNSDLLANTLQNWAHLIDASAKNRAAKASLEAAVAVGAAQEVKAHAIPVGTKNAVWHMGQTTRTIPKGAAYDEGGVTKVSDGTAQISEHGQVHYLVTDPFVLTALTSLEYAGMRGPVMDAMATMKHVLTVGVTASPAFKVRNLIRDSLQAIGTADLNYNALSNIKQGSAAVGGGESLKNFGKAVANAATLGAANLTLKTSDKSQTYISMLASGGLIRFGTMMEGRESDRVRQLIKRGVEGHTILDSESKVKAMYDKYLEPAVMAYNELGNRSEEITRAALYTQLRAQGKSHAFASLMARDLMDFSMQGAWTSVRFLTQIVPFMNARMQGLYKLGRAAHEDPRRFAIVTAATAAFSIGLMAAYGDDDDWKKREDWDRDSFWWFKLGDTAFRIPKPFEIGAIATLAERGVELFTNDEMTQARFLERLRELTLNNLSMNPVPQIVKPIIDIYANKDSFSGRPIETMGMERVKSEYRYNANTSMPARALSTAGNAVAGLVGGESLSPVQIDHMIRGYFGWLGSFVVGGIDSMARPLTNEASRPERDMWKFATQGFISETGGASSRYVSQMYEQAKVLEQAYGTYRDLQKRGQQAEAAEFATDHADELRRYKQIERTKKIETVLNRAIRNVEANSSLTPGEKKARIRQYQIQKDLVARKVAIGL